MQFYKVEGVWKDKPAGEGSESDSALISRLEDVSKDVAGGASDGSYGCFYKASEDVIGIAVVCENRDPQGVAETLLKRAGIQLTRVRYEEITTKAFKNLLRQACKKSLVFDDDEIISGLNIDGLYGYNSSQYGEKIFDQKNERAIRSMVKKRLVSDSLTRELDRILDDEPRKRFAGHPAHYFLETDDHDAMLETYRLLLESLYLRGRIVSRRYHYVDFDFESDVDRNSYETLYRCARGGAIVVRYKPGLGGESGLAGGERAVIEDLCEVMKKYRKDVLTIFCLPKECGVAKAVFMDNLSNICFITISETLSSYDESVAFLKGLAKDDHIRADRQLAGALDADRRYYAAELRRIYDRWYDNKLRTAVFPQYADLAAIKESEVKKKARGSAYSELSKMIGLDSAKKVIDQAINYYKIQRVYAGRSLGFGRTSMHMIFTGAPGTAKTTVARLFSEIMKDNGILSRGHLVETGRGDLVGKYVGWTAKCVKKKFEEAEGGVLFIDEAYSLVDGREGGFGDEAINTIVQEMENHREDMIVIFAGYPDKMEGFLAKNPGLRSRIAFHVNFEDYSVDELCRIAELIASKKGLRLGKGTQERLSKVFEAAVEKDDFGNGRFVRNVIEKAQMSLASRLVELDPADVSDAQVITIMPEDIELPEALRFRKEKLKIGFIA